jgi:ubiquinone/menaquinone biosynthesis C-methylase UbiE
VKDRAATRDHAAAVQYQKCIVRHLLGPWIPDFLACAGLTRGQRVLDVACGTGALTRLAAREVGSSGEVTGLDLAPAMIGVARELSTDVLPSIRWAIGDASRLPYAASRFDAVLCHQGMQFFAEPVQAAREFRRVTAPEGRLAVAVWSRSANNPYFDAVAAAMGQAFGADVERQMQTTFSLGDAARLRAVLEGSGFASVEVTSHRRSLSLPPLGEFVPEHLSGTSLAGVFAAAPAETREAVVAEAMARIRRLFPQPEVVLPFEVHMGRAC